MSCCHFRLLYGNWIYEKDSAIGEEKSAVGSYEVVQ